MPIGVIINCLSVFIGGILGTVAGHKLSETFKNQMNTVLGLCSVGMGISSIFLMKNMPAVIFSIVIGTAMGLAVKLGDCIVKGAELMEKPINRLFSNQSNNNMSKEEFISTLVTIIVLFCASGTGIYGCLDAGMTGDNSILISKSILDLFTSAVFACTMGLVVSVIAIPQFIIFSVLIFLSHVIFPLTTPEMINDFKACGGFLLIATGLRILKIKNFPVADMLVAMVLIMPFSWLWTNIIIPLIS